MGLTSIQTVARKLQGNADGVRQWAQIQGGEELLESICEHIVVFTPAFTTIEP